MLAERVDRAAADDESLVRHSPASGTGRCTYRLGRCRHGLAERDVALRMRASQRRSRRRGVGNPERFETIDETCKRTQTSRRTFYRMLPDLERAGVAVRVPPRTGRVRVSPSGLDAWLRKRGRRGPRVAE